MREKFALKEMKQFRRQIYYNAWISFVNFKHTKPLLRGRSGSISKVQAQEYARQKVELDPASLEAHQAREIKELKTQLSEMGALIKSLQQGQNNNMSQLEAENNKLRQQLIETQSIVQRFQSIHRKHATEERVDQNTLTERVHGAVPASKSQAESNSDAILRRLGRSSTPPNQMSRARRAKAQQMKETNDLGSPGCRSRGRSVTPGGRGSSGRGRGRSLERSGSYDAELDDQLLNSNDLVDDMTVQHIGLDSRRKSILEHSAEKWAEASGTQLKRTI